MQIVYVLDTKDVALNYERIVKLVPLNATKKAEEYKNEKDRLCSLGGALLITAFTAKSPLLFGAHGKPYKETPPFFSLSHSGEKVGIFLKDDGEVGFDIQRIKNYSARLAERIFPEKEIEISCAADYAKFWTMKESAAKLTGEGITNPAKQILTKIDDTMFNFGGKKIFYKTFVKSEYVMTACAYSEICANVSEITVKDLIN